MTWEKIMSESVGNQEQSICGVPDSGHLAGLGAVGWQVQTGLGLAQNGEPHPNEFECATQSGTEIEDCAYQNAATCPDCAGGMFRQGGCFFCPRCGFESCGI